MKSLFKFFPVVATAVLLCLGCPLSGFAASTSVTIGSPLDRFSPAVVNIAAGDQVVWTWAATFHSTTSGTNGVAGDDNGVPSGLWDSGIITTLPHTFTNTFPVAGNFSYYCRVHFNLGMTGAVIVTSGNISPTVSITNPATGALFAAPANVMIQATVTNGSGTVTNVQFRIGSTVLTNETTAPFSAVTNNLAAGDYTLTAIASDSLGATATNSVNITVDTPPTVSITNPASGTVFIAPANLTIQASASDLDAGGSVTNVQFLVGSTVLTNDNNSPFSGTTNNLAAGSYTLSAIASDNLGLKTTNSVNIIVDTPPTVTITNLTDGALLMPAPTNVVIQVSASDSDAGDSVTNVQFLVGSTVLTNDNAAPFAAITNNLAAGSYTLTAIASDINGVTATNSVTITVDTPPAVSITNPASGAVFVVPASVTIQASASDLDAGGSVTNVQFRLGSTILTNDNATPFSGTTNNLAAASYTLFAIASDNLGVKTTNSVNIVVDTPPAVTITNPLNNATLSAPANVNIQASASDLDAGGSVTNVQFLVGPTFLTNETTAPFSAATNNLAAGSYTLFAVASDNNGVKNTNAVTISVVTPVQTTLSGTAQTFSTNFQFTYSANVGLSYIVQRSTNLAPANWITLVTNVAASNPVVFVDNHATNGPGFYRVGRLPNP